MLAIARSFAFAIALSVAAIGAANAAGALAVGVCGAYGYGFDYGNVADARAAALSKCSGGHCQVVGVVRKGCAAIPVLSEVPKPSAKCGLCTNVTGKLASAASTRSR